MSDREKIPLWRDERILKIIAQGVVLGIVIAVLVVLGSNLVTNFQRLGLSFGFDFLFDRSRPASFRIGDSPIPYRATDSYSRAILVGLLNSLRVMVVGIVLATILGITVGLGRLSNNWLVRQIATIYVETFRNTPLLLQLLFWYLAVFLKLPKIDRPAAVFNSFFFSNQGVYLPFPAFSRSTWLSLGVLFLLAILAIVLWRKQTQAMVERGESGQIFVVFFGLIGLLGIFLLTVGLDWQFPQFDSEARRIAGGVGLSPEFATILIGLTFYTAAFIAEVVRAGIQSVNRGQWEAARALGLKPASVMRLVIFPQALRVMIPPLTSEFLNLAKNSSLAIAVGYNDVYAISSTISNKTGKAIEMLLVVMVTYLTINLIISLAMNNLNRAVQLKER